MRKHMLREKQLSSHLCSFMINEGYKGLIVVFEEISSRDVWFFMCKLLTLND